MLIRKIEKLKNNKYKIIMDNEIIITYDNVIIENSLLYKKCIDNELYLNIINKTKYYDVYNKTLKYILKQRKSEKEIRDYLLKYEISDNDRESIINKLYNLNLLNDSEYCIAYINDNIYLGKKGINKIKLELIKKGVSVDIIDHYLSKIDKNLIIEKLQKLIKNKIQANKKHSNNYLKQKILNDMLIMGYSKDDILDILEIEFNSNNNNLDILKNVYKKLHLKLSKKYSGVELKSKLKQSLLVKGFNIDDINHLIEKTEEN